MTLEGKKIAVLISPRGTEEPEFKKPKDAVEAAGASVTVVGIEAGEAKTNNGDLNPGGSYTVDKTVKDVSASDFDGLIIPSGNVGADKLRADADIVSFVRSFFEQAKPVGVICHGPWLLVQADVLNRDILLVDPEGHRERGRHLGRQGCRHGQGAGNQPQARRPAGVLREDRRGVRRRKASRTNPQRIVKSEERRPSGASHIMGGALVRWRRDRGLAARLRRDRPSDFSRA